MTSTNPSYKPSEGKREEFRKYLEKNGVMDALTRVLVNLYEEVDKPEDALEYIRDKLSVIAGLETTKQLQLKLTDAEERIKELETQLESDGKRAGSVPEADQLGDSPIKVEENDPPPEEVTPEENPAPDADQ